MTAVNLPITLGGFTFKGIHSSEFGVRQTPNSRVLSPQKKRTMLEIPGRSTVIVQEDGGYELRVERITCSYVKQEGVSLQRQVRKIAGWLDGIGELTFDYEPEMHYQAFLSSAPPTVKNLEYATFELEFTINHPFAYQSSQNMIFDLENSGESFSITTDGTVKTPAILTIKNVGDQPITNLFIKLTHVTN
jgi:predicted phage tail component-like protein